MKYFLLFLFASICNAKSFGQFGQKNAIYVTVDYHAGNYYGADANLNYIYNEKYSFKIGVNSSVRNAKSKPTGYSPGLFGLTLFYLVRPFDEMINYKIEAGKIYLLNKKGTIRANLSVGIGYTIIEEPTNWQEIEGGLFGPNYTWDTKSIKDVSLTISPKIEFPFSRVFGFTVSPMIQISKNRTYYGIGIGEMFGLLRKKNKSIK